MLLEVVKAVLWAPCTAPGNLCFYPPLIHLLPLLFWSFWLNWVQNCTAASPPLSIQFPRFQGKQFNIMVIQVYAVTSNAEEAEVEQFYEDLQDLLELTPKKMSFSL